MNKKLSQDRLKIIPLGGVGDVTKNMYVYETEKDIVVIDCGVGFPGEDMPGIDLILPDISYLLEKRRKIRGLILTHGHDDHIGALPYVLPKLGVPVFATSLTAGFAEVKLREFNLKTKVEIINPETVLRLGDFTCEFVHVTHSVPDAVNVILQTPAGTIYHASDFKFDWTPVDGKLPEVGKIALAGKKGVLCLLSDSLRSEKPGYSLSEAQIEETFDKELKNCPGRFIVTTHSSNIFRLQQAINVSLRHGRQICFVGRSIEQNVEVAIKTDYLKVPKERIVRVNLLSKYPDKFLTLLVAGSQGQESSALSRIAHGEHRFVHIKSGDVVVFSADPIPGNENAVHSLIDTLSRQGARVVYSEILEDIHVSGHGAAGDLMLMIGLTSPQYVCPIGGTFRQMKQYARLAQSLGYPEEKILLLENGQIVEFQGGVAHLKGKIEVKNILVDGLGVGDIGAIVLRDRNQMAADGIVVVVVPIDESTGEISAEPDIISRGFVYMRHSDQLIQEAKTVVKRCLLPHRGRVFDWQFLRRHLEESLGEFLYQKTQRRPLIFPAIVKV